MDFSFIKLTELYKALLNKGFCFITLDKYLSEAGGFNTIILRHDVEKRYDNALKFAQIQNELGIKGTYYFRILKNSYNPEIVKKIADLGHEIGYHYDDLTFCKGNFEEAIKRFERNLNRLRSITKVKTICMDGSPRSAYDNKDLWKKYDYKAFDIESEPYFDINFDELFYLTDTGRRWDGWKMSLRDKVPQQEKWIKEELVFHSTDDIIRVAREGGRLPDKIMFTFHPQRWNDKPLPWVKELVLQNVKNVAKRGLVLIRSQRRTV